MMNNKKKIYIVRIVFAAAALAVMGVIFFLSSQPGSSSDELSISFTAMLFGKEWDAAMVLNVLIRKFAHITEFAVLGVLVYGFFFTFPISLSLRAALSFCLTAGYAVSDEIHQLFVEGRACQISDMVIDSLGALLAVYVMNLIVKRWLRGKQKPAEDASVCTGALLDAVCGFMNGSKSSAPGVNDGNFKEFMTLLREHKLVPVGFFSLADDAGISEADRALMKNEAYAQIVVQENKNNEFLKAYKAMRQAGARPVCLKGCICASLWREPALRISSDADILAEGEDFRLCQKALEELGFTQTVVSSEEICYQSSRSGCRIELHNRPFPEDAPVSVCNAVVKDLCKNPDSVTVDGVEVLCPPVQEHLIYLVLHAFKHFIGAGVGIRQVMDISLFCAKEGIDWDTVFKKCASVSADGFLSAVLLIGSEYFGLDISAIQTPAFDRTLNCDIMLEDLLQGGIYGSRDADKHHSSRITVNSYSKSQNGKRAATVFLTLNQMKKRYAYLERHPYLLPLAWAQRGIYYLFSDHSVADTLAAGKSRTRMMKYYGIIK